MTKLTPTLSKQIITAVRKSVLTTHRADSCIASTYVLREVLRLGFGIKLMRRSVTAMAFNKQVSAQLDGNVKDMAEVIALTKAPGGWSVGIGFGAEAAVDDSKWAGHLIGITEHDKGFLLWDASLDQAPRPHKDLVLVPVVTQVRNDPYRKDILIKHDDIYIFYRENKVADCQVTTSPDWANQSRLAVNIKQALDDLTGQGVVLKKIPKIKKYIKKAPAVSRGD